MQRGVISVRSRDGNHPTALAAGGRIDEGAWLDVAEAAEITVRTSNYREITATGPALVAVCPNGEDELVLARGRVSAFPGTGVRPGVEVWIATPLGVVRYSDAKIDIEVAADGRRMRATASMARADFAPGPRIRIEREIPGDEPALPGSFREVPLRAGASLVAERAAIPLRMFLVDLVGACTRESEAARVAAEILANGDAGGVAELGEHAAAHVRARQRARLACETARAATGPGPGTLDDSLLAELRAADEKRNQLTPLPARR
jgi:hypothetical protein